VDAVTVSGPFLIILIFAIALVTQSGVVASSYSHCFVYINNDVVWNTMTLYYPEG